MIKTSDTTTKILGALRKASKSISNPVAASTNPAFRSKYADLNSVLSMVRQPLLDADIVVMSSSSVLDGLHYVETRLAHAGSGEWIAVTIALQAEKQTPHGSGSCLTYGRRYGLSAMLAIGSDDADDGNTSSGLRAAAAVGPIARARTAPWTAPSPEPGAPAPPTSPGKKRREKKVAKPSPAKPPETELPPIDEAEEFFAAVARPNEVTIIFDVFQGRYDTATTVSDLKEIAANVKGKIDLFDEPALLRLRRSHSEAAMRINRNGGS